MGYYLDSSEIVDTKGLSTAELDIIINTIEGNVEYYCQDIFRTVSLNRFVNGSGNNTLYPPTGYNNISMLDIVSISKVEYRDEDNLYTTIVATDYRYNKSKIMMLGYGGWTWGKLNYKVAFTLGHDVLDFEDNVDPRYLLKDNAKLVVQKLVTNFLETNFGTTSGTATIQSSEGPYKSESIGGDYSYTIADSLLNLNSDTPTGFSDIDSILQSMKQRRVRARVISPNPHKWNVTPW